MFRPSARLRAGLLVALAFAPRAAVADVGEAQRQIGQASTDVASLAREANVRIGEDRAQYVEEKLADADMFFRLAFYEEASVLYLDIVENYPDQTAYADALYRLGESLYEARDPYGAQEYFERLLQQSSEMRFRPFVQPALGRLIEIAIQMEDFEGIERYFTELNRLPAADVAAITPYFRGKYYFFRGNLAEAERAFMSVPDNAEYTLRARYFLGVVYVKRGDLQQALEAFQRALLSPATTDEDKKTVDLTYLAIGRIQYELHQEDVAIESYQHISTDSELFDEALYEVSWVHLARGDTTKARRSLEMLVIYDPESRFAPEAKLLLGNILLREGRVVLNEECFLLDTERRVAEAAGQSTEGLPALPAECTAPQVGETTATTSYSIDSFRSVKADYGPVFSQIEDAMSSRERLRTYFADMVRTEAQAVMATNLLPPQARAWYVENESVARVQGVLDGLAAIRRYMADTQRLAAQLEAILSGHSAAGAFAEFRSVRDGAVLVANRLARIRASLAGELQRSVSAPAGEAAQVREERRQVEQLVNRLPTDVEGMSSEYEAQRDSIDAVSHVLTESTHTVELVYSMSTALEQYLGSPDNWGNLPEAEVEAILAEVRLIRGAVGHYREQAQGMRQEVDVLRAQVQVGEISTEQAQEIRDRHRQLVARELSLVGGTGAGGTAAQVAGALDELSRVEGDLDTVLRTLEGHAADRSRDLLAAVREERAKVGEYETRLEGVENTAADVVGGYAFENFEAIAGRFEDLILRSDVGIADSAWSLAEEHRRRMIQMGQQRDRDLESIQMEYDDLLGN